MFRCVVLLLAATTLSASTDRHAPARSEPPSDPPNVDARTIETSHLKLTTSTTAAGVTPRALFVDVVPKPKMHVYAPGQEGYITVALSLDRGNTFVAAGPPRFPKAEKLLFKPLNETQFVYSKPFRITQTVKPAPDLAPPANGPITVKGSLRYQACDDKVCFIPQTVPLEWIVKR